MPYPSPNKTGTLALTNQSYSIFVSQKSRRPLTWVLSRTTHTQCIPPTTDLATSGLVCQEHHPLLRQINMDPTRGGTCFKFDVDLKGYTTVCHGRQGFVSCVTGDGHQLWGNLNCHRDGHRFFHSLGGRQPTEVTGQKEGV